METPTAQEVRDWTPRVGWASLGYDAGTTPDKLAFETKLAVAYVEWVTGRLLDSTMPLTLEPFAQKAVALRVVQQVGLDDEDTMESLGAGTTVKNLNVTGFSEQYIEQGEASQAQRKGLMINPHPELNRLLWMLCTPARMAWWRAWLSEGVFPQYGVVEMDWSGSNRWGVISSPGEGGLPGDLSGYGTPYMGLGGEGPLTGELPPSLVLGGEWGWD